MKNFTLLFLFVLIIKNGNTQCHVDDFNALKAIYTALDGDNWTNNSGWSVVKDNVAPPMGCDLSTLFGVGLDQNGRVDSLSTVNPQGNNWNGTIPSAIGDLEFLRVLHLRRNKNINVPFPASMFDFAHLEYLDIAGCDFTGTIPTDLYDLVTLKHLDIGANDFTGSLSSDIDNFSNLEYFHFSDIPLTGSIPNELGNLSNLKTLLFGDNSFTGGLPTTIGNLSNLETLLITSFVRSTPNGSIPTSIGNLTNLKYLELQNLMLSGAFPTTIGNLINLETLIMSDLDISGTIPSSIGNLDLLETLLISNLDQLDGPIPDTFANMADLRSLTINLSNNLDGPIPSSIYNLSDLETLNLNSNDLSDTLSSAIGGMTALKNFRCDGNSISGNFPHQITSLLNLESFNIAFNNEVTGTIPALIGLLSNLKTFNIENCDLYGSIPTSMGNISGLQTINLSGNRLCGSIPSNFSGLNFLSSLGVFGDQLGGCLDISLQSLCGQIFFHADNGQFDASWIDFCNSSSGACNGSSTNGFLDNSLARLYNDMKGSNWTVQTGWLSNDDPCGLQPANSPWHGLTCHLTGELAAIDLSNNGLDSSISKSIGHFCELTDIDFSDNNIDDITVELASLSKLKVLDLESNNIDNTLFLSGQPLPASLVNLNMADNQLTFIPSQLEFLSLTRLDLSNNSIIGNIPSYFSTFKELVSLDISDNLMTGTLPTELGNADVVNGLTYIDLSNNNFEGCIPTSFSNLCNISVDLSGNVNLDNQNFLTFCSQQIGSCPGCHVHLNLSGTIASGTYEASSSITCNGTIQSGANVIFSAPDSVVMTNNFNVENTAVYEVNDTGCNE